MKTKQSKTKVAVGVMAIAGLVLYSMTAGSGSLDPPAAPAPTMKTLDEIYTAASSSGGGLASGTEFAADSRSFFAVRIAEYPGSGVPGIQELEDASKVIYVAHRITVPYDPPSGQATGVRVHSPFSIVKNMDKSSPGLHKACSTGQVLNEVIIDFFDTSFSPTQPYYTITLNQARIVDIGPNTNFVTPDSYKHMEEVSFVYNEIVWHWTPDAAIEQDTWSIPGP